MEQLINNLANTFKDEELIEYYKTSKEIIQLKDKIIEMNEKQIQVWMEHFSNLNVDNQEQKKEIQSLKYRLKERNDYIHNLKWEHSNQLDKLKEKNKKLKEEINQLKTLLGEPFVPY